MPPYTQCRGCSNNWCFCVCVAICCWCVKHNKEDDWPPYLEVLSLQINVIWLVSWLLYSLPAAPSPSCLHFVVSTKQTRTSNPPVKVRWHKWQRCVFMALSASAQNNTWPGAAGCSAPRGVLTYVTETQGLLKNISNKFTIIILKDWIQYQSFTKAWIAAPDPGEINDKLIPTLNAVFVCFFCGLSCIVINLK